MKPIVLFVHIHYLETWLGLSRRIEETVSVPFRLFVTTTHAAREIARPDSERLVAFEVMPVANRGRDVSPFLQALRAAGDFDIGLKLHGKRSVHRLDGEAWRDALVASLLPSGEGVERFVDRMSADRRLGLVGPSDSLCSTARHVGGNQPAMRKVAERLGLSLEQLTQRTPFFSAGTMFWFRRDALARAIETDIDDAFAPEAGQTDGTEAHALERLFPALVEERGFLALAMDVAIGTDAQTQTGDLRNATLARLDTDKTFVRLPGPVVAFVMRRLRFAVPVYLALPTPVRRLIKGVAGGATMLVSRRERRDGTSLPPGPTRPLR